MKSDYFTVGAFIGEHTTTYQTSVELHANHHHTHPKPHMYTRYTNTIAKLA